MLISLHKLATTTRWVREVPNPQVSRASLDRCLRRHGVAKRRECGVTERQNHAAIADLAALPRFAGQDPANAWGRS